MSVVSEESEVARVADPLPPFGAFQLADLPELTSDYLHSVEVVVDRVTGSLVGGQEGTFSVRITNGPIRLTGWTLHLESTNPDVAKVLADSRAVFTFRTGGSSSSPEAAAGTDHESLYVFFLDESDTFEPDSVLEPDEVHDFIFDYKAIGRGNGTLTAHLHGTVDVASVFPRGRGTDGAATVTVLHKRD